DLEVDRVPDAHAMAQTVVGQLDPGPLDAEHLTHQRSETRHRTSELPTEDLCELVGLLVTGLLVDEHPEPPVPVGHHLRGVDDHHGVQSRDVRTVDLALAHVERERRTAEVVRRAVVERQVAWAHQLARARLRIAALHAPGHPAPPLDSTGRFSSGPSSVSTRGARLPRGATRPRSLRE